MTSSRTPTASASGSTSSFVCTYISYTVWLTCADRADAYVTSTGNKHAVLEAGISSDRLDIILSTWRHELATQLKREWTKANSMCPSHCGA
jgi:hypothetical protein